MIKTLLKQVKQYKKESLLTPLFTALEVLMEVLIPFITASIIDKGIEQGNIGQVYFYGGLMLIMAFLSLLSGVLAGKYAAAASSGFACNLRDGMYENTFVEIFIFKYRQVQYSRPGHPNDDRRHQCTELLPDDTEDRCEGAVNAGMQHGHVLLNQCKTEPDFPGGHRGSGGCAGADHDQDDKNL